mmetsp:Transcript_2758/g.6879  ORF Transcript_2758/g.6879 Transcript_2758/m.6879 type:complete len:307 (+) Transcript_2758:51-971(+)
MGRPMAEPLHKVASYGGFNPARPASANGHPCCQDDVCTRTPGDTRVSAQAPERGRHSALHARPLELLLWGVPFPMATAAAASAMAAAGTVATAGVARRPVVKSLSQRLRLGGSNFFGRGCSLLCPRCRRWVAAETGLGVPCCASLAFKDSSASFEVIVAELNLDGNTSSASSPSAGLAGSGEGVRKQRSAARAGSGAGPPQWSPSSSTTHAATTVMSSCLPPWQSRPYLFELSPKGTFAVGSSERSCAASASARATASAVVAHSGRPTSSLKIGGRARSTMCKISRSCRLSRKPSVNSSTRSPTRT